MDNKSEIIKLPFWETIRRSFIYVLARPGLFLQVSAIWFAFLIYEVICGFPLHAISAPTIVPAAGSKMLPLSF